MKSRMLLLMFIVFSFSIQAHIDGSEKGDKRKGKSVQTPQPQYAENGQATVKAGTNSDWVIDCNWQWWKPCWSFDDGIITIYNPKGLTTVTTINSATIISSQSFENPEESENASTTAVSGDLP